MLPLLSIVCRSPQTHGRLQDRAQRALLRLLLHGRGALLPHRTLSFPDLAHDLVETVFVVYLRDKNEGDCEERTRSAHITAHKQRHNVTHSLFRARLHERTAPSARELLAFALGHLALAVEVALVANEDALTAEREREG